MITDRSRALIIDGSQWLYIYSMTQNPLYNTDFIDVAVPYYTLRRVYDTIARFQPTDVYVVFDIGRDLKKKRKYEKYKSLRNIRSVVKGRSLDSMIHDRIAFARKLVHQILETTPIKSFLIPFVEGDTLLAFITKNVEADEKFLLSTDKDMYQLLDDKSLTIISRSTITKIEEEITYRDIDRVWSSVIGKELNLTKIIEATNHTPIAYKCIPYYRAFIGDASDSIPGIKGVGPSVIGYIIQYQQYTNKHSFSSPDEFFDWLNTNRSDIENLYTEIQQIAYGKKKSRAKIGKLYELINDEDVRKAYLTFFELMDFDYAISELPVSVYSELIDKIREKKSYDESAFLELIRQYDFNSENDYMKWHIINNILSSDSKNWKLLGEKSKVYTLEQLFNYLVSRSKSTYDV
jgi:5'-3' exonuclease